MFEKFNIEDLYYCSIAKVRPVCIDNMGGCIGITYSDSKDYDTIVWLVNGRYYDINNLNKIINIVKFPQRNMPMVSSDNYLYILNENSLVSFKEKNDTKCKQLQRLPFGLNRLIK